MRSTHTRITGPVLDDLWRTTSGFLSENYLPWLHTSRQRLALLGDVEIAS